MKADGKSLDDKRNLLVDEEVFDAFSFGGGVNELTQTLKKELHQKFNLPDIIERFPKREQDKNKRTEQSFLVPFEEIKSKDWDLSFNRYKEVIYDEIEFDEPKIIIERIGNLQNTIIELTQQLKNEI